MLALPCRGSDQCWRAEGWIECPSSTHATSSPPQHSTQPSSVLQPKLVQQRGAVLPEKLDLSIRKVKAVRSHATDGQTCSAVLLYDLILLYPKSLLRTATPQKRVNARRTKLRARVGCERTEAPAGLRLPRLLVVVASHLHNGRAPTGHTETLKVSANGDSEHDSSRQIDFAYANDSVDDAVDGVARVVEHLARAIVVVLLQCNQRDTRVSFKRALRKACSAASQIKRTCPQMARSTLNLLSTGSITARTAIAPFQASQAMVRQRAIGARERKRTVGAQGVLFGVVQSLVVGPVAAKDQPRRARAVHCMARTRVGVVSGEQTPGSSVHPRPGGNSVKRSATGNQPGDRMRTHRAATKQQPWIRMELRIGVPDWRSFTSQLYCGLFSSQLCSPDIIVKWMLPSSNEYLKHRRSQSASKTQANCANRAPRIRARGRGGETRVVGHAALAAAVVACTSNAVSSSEACGRSKQVWRTEVGPERVPGLQQVVVLVVADRDDVRHRRRDRLDLGEEPLPATRR